MSESKHTPGPWEVVDDPGQDCPECGENVGETHMVAWRTKTGAVVGIAAVMADDREEANAHLIAAAPELLAAAEEVMAGLNARIDAAGDRVGAVVPVFDGIAALHTAICKARGEV